MPLLTKKHLLLPLAGLLLTGQWGCAHPESTARKRYQAAVSVEQSGNIHQAERLYQRLVTDYPQTEGAADATRQMERLQMHREQLHKEQFMPVLHRLRTVLIQYQQMTGTTPMQFSDFDREDFPFGADHLSRIVPPGFAAYLQVEPARDTFLLYAFKEGAETGYSVDNHSPVLKSVQRTAVERRLRTEEKNVEKRGDLLLLRK